MRARAWRVAVALAVGLWPLAAVPADGRVEINQSVVAAAGGFPYTIGSPGRQTIRNEITASIVYRLMTWLRAKALASCTHIPVTIWVKPAA